MSLEQWETFYRGGALATGPAGPDGVYDLEVRQAWVGFFGLLRDRARILDIGTGNGVVPLIAVELAASRHLNWDIHAADLARIDPPRHVRDGMRRFAGVTFHPGVASERLPFETASFDAVSGHYALEYADVRAALGEVFRVLKAGSDAQFILHHTDSALVQNARRSMREADLALKETRIYRKLHRVVTLEQPTPDLALRMRDELVAAVRTMKEALAQTSAQGPGGGHLLRVALDAVQKLLIARKQLRPEVVGIEVDRAENELRAAWRRLDDLVSHALDAQGMQRIHQLASELGFTRAEHFPLHHAGDNLVGWQFLLHRP